MYTTRFIHDWEQPREQIGLRWRRGDRTANRRENERMAAEINLVVDQARLAQRSVEDWDEARIDALLADLSEAVAESAQSLAVATVTETEMGNAADKMRKIEFAARQVYASIAGQIARGRIGVDHDGVSTVASPVGVVLGLLPVTNPVATMIFKILIALKGRNALVLSPHRRAVGVCGQTLGIVEGVLRAHGAPPALVQLVTETPSRRRTALLMAHEGIALVLATGGSAMVKAAYSSGTPAIGVGPGNAPAFVAPDADLPAAARSLVEGSPSTTASSAAPNSTSS